MTANNGKYDCMKISQAMGLFQELLGDGNKVLIPWVVSIQPDAINSCETDVTITFGCQMDRSVTRPLVSSDEDRAVFDYEDSQPWENGCKAKVTLHAGWDSRPFSVSPSPVNRSSNQIPLNHACEKSYEYSNPGCTNPNFEDHSWGTIKRLFDVAYGGSSAEALSGDCNILCWNEFGDSSSSYSLLRRIDDILEYAHYATVDHGDTLFIDDDVVPGAEYHYRIVNDVGDTLYHTEERSAGLHLSSTLTMSDAEYPISTFCDGDYLYVVLKSNTCDNVVVKKLGIADPANPVVVGSRLYANIPVIYNSSDNALARALHRYLLLQHYETVFFIDITDDALPVVGELTDPFTIAGSHIYDITTIDNIAYIAGRAQSWPAVGELVAVDFNNPALPEVIGRFDPPEAGDYCYFNAIEAVGGFLYVTGKKVVDIEGWPFQEIIRPIVSPRGDAVSFSIEKSTIREPFGLDSSFTLCDPCVGGVPRWRYAFGKVGWTSAILDVGDPLNPTVVRTIEEPLRINSGMGLTMTYSFDSERIFTSALERSDFLGRGIFAFGIASTDSLPCLAVGDTLHGYYEGHCVESWGNYLYCLHGYSEEPNSQERVILRTFEKSRGCDADLALGGEVAPLADLYEIGQSMTVSWEAVGCPVRVDVKLIEDDTTAVTLAAFDAIETPGLQTGSYSWAVEPIDEIPDGHEYVVQVIAWNIEGMSDSYGHAFEIVEDLPPSKDDPVPIIQLENATTPLLPVPLEALSGSETTLNARSVVALPPVRFANESALCIRVRGLDDATITLPLLRWFALDVPVGLDLEHADGIMRIVETKSRARFCDFDPSRLDEQNFPPEVMLTELPRGDGEDGPVVIAPGGSARAHYRLPPRLRRSRRYLLLEYAGYTGNDMRGASGVPEAFLVEDPYPNPFNPATAFAVHLPRQSLLTCEVYDVAGRRVKTLIDRSLLPGIHRVTWDGRNESGTSVASGVYFVRVKRNGSPEAVKKIVLMR